MTGRPSPAGRVYDERDNRIASLEAELRAAVESRNDMNAERLRAEAAVHEQHRIRLSRAHVLADAAVTLVDGLPSALVDEALLNKIAPRYGWHKMTRENCQAFVDLCDDEGDFG